MKFLSMRSFTLTTRVSINIYLLKQLKEQKIFYYQMAFHLVSATLISLCKLHIKTNIMLLYQHTKNDGILSPIICFVIIPVLSMSLLFSFAFSSVAGLNSVNIFSPGGKPHGLTYADHIKNFWKW